MLTAPGFNYSKRNQAINRVVKAPVSRTLTLGPGLRNRQNSRLHFIEIWLPSTLLSSPTILVVLPLGRGLWIRPDKKSSILFKFCHTLRSPVINKVPKLSVQNRHTGPIVHCGTNSKLIVAIMPLEWLT